MSQAALARRLDVAQAQISAYERGRYEVDGELARDIARVFGCPELTVWIGLRLPLPREVKTDDAIVAHARRTHPEIFTEVLGEDPVDKPPRRATRRTVVTRTGETEPKTPPDTESAV